MDRRLIMALTALTALSAWSCEDDSGPAGTTDSRQDTGAQADSQVTTDSSQSVDSVTALDTSTPGDSTTTTSDTTSTQDTAGPTDTTGGADVVNLACHDEDDCTTCAYQIAPKEVGDCSCILCPAWPMTKSECQANAQAWQDVCANTDWPGKPCPVVSCAQPTPVACDGGTCVDACTLVDCPLLDCPLSDQFQPFGECCPKCKETPECVGSDDCTNCSYETQPGSVGDCYCPICPSHPMSKAECITNGAAWQLHCDQWSTDQPCPVAICLPSPAAQCDGGGQCVAGNPDS